MDPQNWTIRDEISCTKAVCIAKGSHGRFGTVCPHCGDPFGNSLPRKVKKDLRRQLKLSPLFDQGPPAFQQRQPEPAKPVDLPPAVLRSIMHYGTLFEGEPLQTPKAISYLMTKHGVMEVRRTKIGTTSRYVEAVPGLQEMSEGMVLTVPKIPWELIRETVAFFREVSRKRGSCEAFVQYWYHPEHGYHVFVPKQDVGGAHVHVKPEDNYPGYANEAVHVADCHSHGSQMDAFFSGTDDADERTKGDRIYMVIGKVLDDAPIIKLRAVAGNGFLSVDPGAIIAPPATTPLILTGEVTAKEKGSTKLGYAADPFAGASFPSAWMDALIAEQNHIQLAWDQSRLPEHYRIDGSGGGSATADDITNAIFGRTHTAKKRLTRNAQFLPGTAFEDYDTHDGGTIRVYANGVVEDITEKIEEEKGPHVFTGD